MYQLALTYHTMCCFACRRAILEKSSQEQAKRSKKIADAVRAARQQLPNKTPPQPSKEQSPPQKVSAPVSWKPKKGDTVFVTTLNSHATVVKVTPSGSVTLQKGILKMQATLDQLLPSQ
jgi:dsDNA-specific endonuclease/ATPase MutS2